MKELPGLLNRILKPLAESGIITNIVLDTYKREIERYGFKTMEDAERAFMSSSELVAEYLHENRDELQTIQFAILSSDALFSSFNLDIPARLNLLENICRGLMNELGQEKQLRDDLNRKYREHQQTIRAFMAEGQVFFTSKGYTKLRIFKKDLNILKRAMSRHEPAGMSRCIGDILHMHMNRIFSAEQRKKELVIYYLCLRFYLSLKARSVLRLTSLVNVPAFQ